MTSYMLSAYGALLSQHGDDLPTDLMYLSDDELHRVLVDLYDTLEALSSAAGCLDLDAEAWRHRRSPRSPVDASGLMQASLNTGNSDLNDMLMIWGGDCIGRPVVNAPRAEVEQALRQAHADMCHLQRQLATMAALAQRARHGELMSGEAVENWVEAQRVA